MFGDVKILAENNILVLIHVLMSKSTKQVRFDIESSVGILIRSYESIFSFHILIFLILGLKTEKISRRLKKSMVTRPRYEKYHNS